MCFRLLRGRKQQSVSSREHGAIFLQDNATKSKTVKCHEGDLVQRIVKEVCQELGIEPMARFFFALCNRESQVPLSPFSHLSKQESKRQYQLRVFVNVSNSWYWKHVSATVYDYYYQQLCDDFLNNDNMQPHVSLNSAVWMAAINMALEAKNRGTNFEELVCAADRYMPKFLHRRYQSDNEVRRKLKEVFDRFCKLNVDSNHYVNKFLEVYEKDSTCGQHIFPLNQSKRVSLLSMESQHVMVSWKEGIQKVAVVGDIKNCQEMISSIANVSTLTANFASRQLVISKTDETEAQISFATVKDLVGFSVIVQTYYWLKVDCNCIILRGDIAPPSGISCLGFGESNRRAFCHAPISESVVEQSLLEHFSEGNFLLRESRTIDNAYTLSVCHDDQIIRYRIICSEEGAYSFKDLVKLEGDQEWQPRIHKKFPTLFDLIKNHEHRADGLATLLGTNICPEVAGKVPLLPSWNHSDASRSSTSSAYSGISLSSTTGAANCVLDSNDRPQSEHCVLWSKPLTNMQCRVCQQKCSRAEFVHLCSNCDHFYCINCVTGLPKMELSCYNCQPIAHLQLRPKERAHGSDHLVNVKDKFAAVSSKVEVKQHETEPNEKCVDMSAKETTNTTVNAVPSVST